MVARLQITDSVKLQVTDFSLKAADLCSASKDAADDSAIQELHHVEGQAPEQLAS